MRRKRCTKQNIMMDEELYERFVDDPLRHERHRATINSQFVDNVGKKIQQDDPRVLTDDVMSFVTSTAYMSILPMFNEQVREAERDMHDDVVRRAYKNVRTALILFTKGWPTHSDIATDRDWHVWIESM